MIKVTLQYIRGLLQISHTINNKITSIVHIIECYYFFYNYITKKIMMITINKNEEHQVSIWLHTLLGSAQYMLATYTITK